MCLDMVYLRNVLYLGVLLIFKAENLGRHDLRVPLELVGVFRHMALQCCPDADGEMLRVGLMPQVALLVVALLFVPTVVAQDAGT